MKSIFQVEVGYFFKWAVMFFFVHLVFIFYFFGFVAESYYSDNAPWVMTYIIYGVLALQLGFHQMRRYAKNQAWRFLNCSPVSRFQLYSGLSLAGCMIILVVVFMPVFFLMLWLSHTSYVGPDHFFRVFHIAGVAISYYLLGQMISVTRINLLWGLVIAAASSIGTAQWNGAAISWFYLVLMIAFFYAINVNYSIHQQKLTGFLTNVVVSIPATIFTTTVCLVVIAILFPSGISAFDEKVKKKEIILSDDSFYYAKNKKYVPYGNVGDFGQDGSPTWIDGWEEGTSDVIAMTTVRIKKGAGSESSWAIFERPVTAKAFEDKNLKWVYSHSKALFFALDTTSKKVSYWLGMKGVGLSPDPHLGLVSRSMRQCKNTLFFDNKRFYRYNQSLAQFETLLKVDDSEKIRQCNYFRGSFTLTTNKNIYFFPINEYGEIYKYINFPLPEEKLKNLYSYSLSESNLAEGRKGYIVSFLYGSAVATKLPQKNAYIHNIHFSHSGAYLHSVVNPLSPLPHAYKTMRNVIYMLEFVFFHVDQCLIKRRGSCLHDVRSYLSYKYSSIAIIVNWAITVLMMTFLIWVMRAQGVPKKEGGIWLVLAFLFAVPTVITYFFLKFAWRRAPIKPRPSALYKKLSDIKTVAT